MQFISRLLQGLGLSVIFASCNSNPIRSLPAIINAGFYIYQFEEGYESANGWEKTIQIWSFDKHCGNLFSEDDWNPIQITYTNHAQTHFQIRISPQDAIFDVSQSMNSIALDADWIPNHTGDYYIGSGGETQLRIKDRFGMDVIISTFLSPKELPNLIDKLHYFGPDLESSDDPWKAHCN